MPIQINLENEAILVEAVENGQLRVDNYGRVWRANGNRAERKTAKGYLQVGIYHEGSWVRGFAHRLVYRTRTGVIPEGLTINHKNGNKTDNRPINLELATMQQQALHKIYVLGKNRTLFQHGEKHRLSKLSNNDVEEIRRRYMTEPDITQIVLARRFQVSQTHISGLVSGARRLSQGGPLTVLRRQRRASVAVVAAVATNQTADNIQPTV